jgi:hypothetical protein
MMSSFEQPDTERQLDAVNDLTASLESLAALALYELDEDKLSPGPYTAPDAYYIQSNYMIKNQSELGKAKPTNLCRFCQHLFNNWAFGFHINSSG